VPIVRKSFEEARRSAKKTDWRRIDAMTDEDLARQIAEDADVAPDMSKALERGEFVRLHIVDLFGIRRVWDCRRTLSPSAWGSIPPN